MTARMATPLSIALLAAQVSSPSSTSSSDVGVTRMASHVFCTCMREKAEYSASKLAAIITLMQMAPDARNWM
ncbi:hypothetical protein GALL_426230 [mine drainage metagenome]|uniref:Uncharacterized protein n=1 Tax=mine drainage metagenome TaxID=410659 RepID=A0A1J5QI90_9ZZZZ